jgi:hypothetical protein
MAQKTAFKKSVTLILSVNDFDTLVQVSNEFGLKKSEFLRTLIQGIGSNTKIQTECGYGMNIPIQIKKKLFENIATKLKDILVIELGKNIRNKRINILNKQQ